MIPIDLHLPYTHTESDLIEAFAKAARISHTRAADYVILRKSIDARKKSDIQIVYQVAEKAATPKLSGIAGLIDPSAFAQRQVASPRVLVVGAGPAGLFATLFLALAGRRPILIERGQPVEQRQIDVARFWSGGALDPESNVQFGEGGAGTFSDGKLTTGIRDPRCRAVLEEFILLGAPAEILYLSKPHVGTDRLRAVVVAIRQKILQHGGEIRFGARLGGLTTSADRENGHRRRVNGAIIEQKGAPEGISGALEKTGETGVSEAAGAFGLAGCTDELAVDALILAVGHSARDTFRLLQQEGVTMNQKPFSVGLRIEHRQHLIDQSQYGRAAGHPSLPPAEYKLSCPVPGGRTVYTFCMCPGGQVIASASAAGEVVTNGMSHYHRDGENANSALLVPVGPDEFASDDPLAGMYFQQQLEQKAYRTGGGNHKAPAQLVGDYLQSGSSVAAVAPVNPTYSNGITITDLSAVLPPFVTDGLREGLPLLSRKLHSFADPGAILTGVETRSSSPVRIARDETGQSSLSGLFPCGEGAGYAGGILSAAVDGLRCAEWTLARTSVTPASGQRRSDRSEPE